MTDVMIDIETFGVGGNSAILQVGACYFDLDTGSISSVFKRNISLASCLLAGMEIDNSTVEWWRKQPQSAQESLLGPADSLTEVLVELSGFLSGSVDLRVWANGTDFDIALLKNAYAKCGLIVPFSYNSGRDLRTVLDLARRSGYVEGNFTPEVEHDALSDCRSQVARLHAAVQFKHA